MNLLDRFRETAKNPARIFHLLGGRDGFHWFDIGC